VNCLTPNDVNSWYGQIYLVSINYLLGTGWVDHLMDAYSLLPRFMTVLYRPNILRLRLETLRAEMLLTIVMIS